MKESWNSEDIKEKSWSCYVMIDDPAGHLAVLASLLASHLQCKMLIPDINCCWNGYDGTLPFMVKKLWRFKRRETFSVSALFHACFQLQSPFQIKTVLYNTFTIQWSIGLLASIINGVYSLLYSSKWTVSHCGKTRIFVQKLFWYFWLQNCGFKWPKWPPMALLASNDFQWPPLTSNDL